MEFKEWLKAEMKAREWGPSELAHISKVPQPTIFRILSGETKDPRIGTVKRIERALGVQSPELEAPAQHQELITAWELLSQKQRHKYFAQIKATADENEDIRADASAKPKTKAKPPHAMPDTHRPADRRHGLSFFGGAERRKETKDDAEK